MLKSKILLILFLTLITGQSVHGQKIDKKLISPNLKELPDSLKRKTLTELSNLFGTDKRPAMHNFIEIYERNFAPIKDSIKKFFEIGIFNGASHKMWKCYFPNAEVYGIDIKEKPWVEKLGIHTSIANQGKRSDLQSFVEEFGSSFDVILDDGSHIVRHQQVSFAFLFRHLKPGGLYIIEDVHTSLPEFYSDDFEVDSTGSNTTLKMINDYIATEKIVSEYMTLEEIRYLEQNIEYVDLSKRKSGMHSTLCVFRKKL
ncbi:MAG: SAM-dependent methyltransferase [Flavobacteriaceae bacterium]|jgi:SAM-dependent methyltransferase